LDIGKPGAGVANNACSNDRRQSVLLTGQRNFPALLQRIVEGLRLPGNGVKEGGRTAIIITQQASGTAKIDLLVAAFNAIAWMAANPASAQPSMDWL
jgi:hypothetical protein